MLHTATRKVPRKTAVETLLECGSHRLSLLLAVTLTGCAAWTGATGLAAFARGQRSSGSATTQDPKKPDLPPKTLTITPPSILILVGEPHVLHLSDDQGRPVHGATWTVSNASVAEIHEDSEVRITALRTGKIVVTAEWGNLKAQAKVTILNVPGALGGGSGTITHVSSSSGLEVTPSTVGMLVGEIRYLRLSDEKGLQIRSANWKVSDGTLAKITSGEDVTLLALAPGQLSVTGASNGREASARINIHSGTSLPQGTIRWSVEPAPGFSSTMIRQAFPSEGGPDIYAIETDACSRTLTRALTSDGREMWRTLIDPRELTAREQGKTSGPSLIDARELAA
jgi:hypothetical protein